MTDSRSKAQLPPTTRRGVYPGSFNPPTIAHLAVSEAAKEHHQLDIVVWTVSRAALGKLDLNDDRLSERLQVLEAVAAEISWLDIALTSDQLLVDISVGFDVLVMGADKWHQIQELHWYQDAAHRDQSLSDLPELAVAPREGLVVPEHLALPIDPALANVSSSAARAGDHSVMLPEAVEHARSNGEWWHP